MAYSILYKRWPILYETRGGIFYIRREVAYSILDAKWPILYKSQGGLFYHILNTIVNDRMMMDSMG